MAVDRCAWRSCTFAAYDKLQNQPALRWVNDALAQSVAKALRAAAERVPQRYQDIAGST